MVRFSLKSPLGDGELLARFQLERDREAFGELITRHGPLVWRYCARQLHATDADDAFQAVFLVLALKVESIRNPNALASWLLGTARRVIRQARRRKSFQILTDDVAGPERDAAEFWLDEELARLPEKLRDVVVLCLVHERTQPDAADKLGISERTLRRRLDEGKTRLRAQLTRQGLAPAVVLALFANLNASPAAIPAKLGEAAVDTTFRYLVGLSPMTAPAILATGVMMTATKKLVTVTLLTLLVGTTLVGIGLTQSPPATEKPTAKVEPAKPAEPVKPAEPPTPAKLSGPWVAPFRVEAPIPAYQRAIENELRHQYQVQSEIMTGGTILEGEEATLIVVYDNTSPNRSPNYSGSFARVMIEFGVSFEFSKDANQNYSNRKLNYITLPSDLGIALRYGVIPTAKRHLLAKYCNLDQNLPDWVELALASARSGSEFSRYETTANQYIYIAITSGSAFRFRKLFSPVILIERGKYNILEQSLSVWHFLHSPELKHSPELELKVRVDGPKIVKKKISEISPTTPLTAGVVTDRRPSMAAAEFIRLGMANDAGWDVAAKTVYGFADLDAMEKAWIEWVVKMNAKPADKVDADRIPATGVRKP